MIRVNGREIEWRQSMTIQDVLNDCGYTFRMIAVWIDGTPYRREHIATAVGPDGSAVLGG